jgi:hypothetical protein
VADSPLVGVVVWAEEFNLRHVADAEHARSCWIERLRRAVSEYDADCAAEARRAYPQCRSCWYLPHGTYVYRMRGWGALAPCGLCGGRPECLHGPLCRRCALERGLCVRCGGRMD